MQGLGVFIFRANKGLVITDIARELVYLRISYVTLLNKVV